MELARTGFGHDEVSEQRRPSRLASSSSSGRTCTRPSVNSPTRMASGSYSLAVAVMLLALGGGAGVEVVWEDDGGAALAAGGGGGGGGGLRPVTGVCGLTWRRARPEQLSRINDKVWMLVDGLQQDPTDVQLYSAFEVACKDNGDHNTRLRLLATIMRLADFDELRHMVLLNQGYALGDRLFGHAKVPRACDPVCVWMSAHATRVRPPVWSKSARM